ncbi:hypothetical protein LS684_18470 [Cytobacillus spongiae]|jgi:hypothetical protein|uniref:hypothetical protein n=1 Tax=Cytobacillus spongiae TaxID=2901381 RepID=UPI001F3F5646|nr:hypothetical protein [Cytobacillus spongiae]UII55588.1 hypothetical protein LS684_18470 [Cytobacillus spongiae]
MESSWLKRKFLVATITSLLSTTTTYLIFSKYIDLSIIWIIFLVFTLAIFTYGLVVSFLIDKLTKKINNPIIKALFKLIGYSLFGGLFFLAEFISLYGLIAGIFFFIIEELFIKFNKLPFSAGL